MPRAFRNFCLVLAGLSGAAWLSALGGHGHTFLVAVAVGFQGGVLLLIGWRRSLRNWLSRLAALFCAWALLMGLVEVVGPGRLWAKPLTTREFFALADRGEILGPVRLTTGVTGGYGPGGMPWVTLQARTVGGLRIGISTVDPGGGILRIHFLEELRARGLAVEEGKE
jgi:hypothetical protein